MRTITKSFSAILFFLFLMSPWPAQAQPTANQPSDKWEFAATPYLWGIGMSGDIEIAGRELDFQASTFDLLKSLDFALMGNFAARRNRWSFDLDALHADMGQEVTLGQATPAIQNPRLDSGMTIFEADVGYGVAKSLDVLAGIRTVSTSVALKDDAGELAKADESFVDPIVGARFHRELSKRFWVIVRGDVGGFGAGSDFSWFVNADLGIRLSHLLSLDLGYRTWSFDFKSSDDLKRLDMTLAGFGGGLTFHF